MRMKKVQLPANHQRSLSVVARAIEESLNDVATRLQSGRSANLLRQIEPSFTDEERSAILATAEEIRNALADLVNTFDLSPSSVTEKQIVLAQYAHIWTLLEDSFSGKMRGYGEIPPDAARVLDDKIGSLLEKVERLRRAIP
jgi:hypothetical protein